MKKIKFIIHCLTSKIKKYFFKEQENDISHECENVLDNMEITSSEDLKMTEEYALKYNATTRWQTL